MLDSLDTLIAFILIMLVISLLITIVVQMVSAGLNLRGVNLAQGLKRTFAVIDPQSDAQTKQLANYILKGRYLSDSFLPDWPIFRWWRHAEAVRPREAFDAIQRIALGKEPANYISTWKWIKISTWKCTKSTWQWIKSWWKAPAGSATTTQVKTSLVQRIKAFWKGESGTNLQDTALRILRGLGIPDDKITTAKDAINATDAEALKKLKEFSDAAETAYDNFNYWTCTSQERAQQWLTMHTRILTIVFAAAAAVALQLDAVEIFKTVSSNKAVRDKLVAQAGAVTAQADKIVHDSKSVLQKAFDTWPDRTDPSVQPAIASVAVEPSDTREKFVNRVGNAIASANDKEKNKHLSSLNDTIDKVAFDTLKQQAGEYAGVRADLDRTGFEIFPQKGWRWGEKWSDGWTRRHRAGVLFSIGLLSLGAPFWYSILKNLVNLRSQVAQSISSEQKKQKRPDSSVAPPPPTPLPPPKGQEQPKGGPASGAGQAGEPAP
jgi:hypothetical protein